MLHFSLCELFADVLEGLEGEFVFVLEGVEVEGAEGAGEEVLARADDALVLEAAVDGGAGDQEHNEKYNGDGDK